MFLVQLAACVICHAHNTFHKVEINFSLTKNGLYPKDTVSSIYEENELCVTYNEHQDGHSWGNLKTAYLNCQTRYHYFLLHNSANVFT